MNVDAYRELLDDFADGALPEDGGRDLRAHLLSCPDCRLALAEIRQIKAGARALPRLDPPERVWEAIAKAIRCVEPSLRRGGWNRLLPLAASAVLAVVGSLLLTALPPPSSPEASPPGAQDWQLAARDYESSLSGLEQIVEKDSASLDPGVAASVRASLSVLDQAIGESRAAAESQPENEVAQESLLQAFRRKLQLLESTILLINDVRKGELDADSFRLMEEIDRSGAPKRKQERRL